MVDDKKGIIQSLQGNYRLDLLLTFAWYDSLEGEAWKEVKGTDGRYYISSAGRALSLAQDRIYLLNPYINNGYYAISIVNNGCNEIHYIHKLVADAFIPNPDNKPIIHHLDQNRLNNNLNNLMRVSSQEHAEIHAKSNEKLLH